MSSVFWGDFERLFVDDLAWPGLPVVAKKSRVPPDLGGTWVDRQRFFKCLLGRGCVFRKDLSSSQFNVRAQVLGSSSMAFFSSTIASAVMLFN